jgi:DNA-binding CsgD family transcriptional regulator/tetratricopeptide (TPR) repeat protein
MLDLVAGFLHWALGEYEPATARFTDALAAFSDIGDVRGAATAHFGRGSIFRDQERSDDAEIELLSALAIFEELDDPAWIAFCLSVLGAVARQTGRYDEAIVRLERGLALTRELRFPGGMSPLVDHLGDIARERGEFMRALDYYRQALPNWVEQKDPHGAADSLAGYAAALEGIGDFESATTLLSAAAAAYGRLGFPRSRHSKALNDQTLLSLRHALGDERFQACWEEGQSMPLELALDTAAAYEPHVHEVPPVPPHVELSNLRSLGLTPREIEIMEYMMTGRTNNEIGEALFISPRTVGTHVANIFGKLGVTSRSAAVAAALRARETVSPS